MRLSRANKRDNNEAPIVKALEAIGAVVWRLDFIDLLVYYPPTKTLRLLEVKAENGRLTKSQKDLMRDYPHLVEVVREPEEAIRIVTGSRVKMP